MINTSASKGIMRISEVTGWLIHPPVTEVCEYAEVTGWLE